LCQNALENGKKTGRLPAFSRYAFYDNTLKSNVMIAPFFALLAVLAIVIYFITKNAKRPDKGQNGETL
jgi:hypothetical protein